MDEPAAPANPGVRFPPLLLFVAGLVAGWALDRYVVHLPLLPVGVQRIAGVAGPVLVVAGLAIILWGVLTFRRARTGIYPTQPASRIVYAGPYRFTRNPMYTGMLAAYLGGMLLARTAWPLLLLPAVLLLLQHFVISREERYLEAEFGAEYHEYRQRVRRWL
ncbi:isoprenylcysteine carboxylmethyltransferase family protein [Longimicrobium sp.]|uniref:methyltransferase family protein n=1 Tax=Longimicrobium sp. TaxID=2029185 RepID=UPI002EDBA851